MSTTEQRHGWATRTGDVPQRRHYALIMQNSVNVPGDERSRTHPGHGYPASTEYFLQYEWYLDREDWIRAVQRAYSERREFRAHVVTPAKIKSSVVVEEEETQQ